MDFLYEFQTLSAISLPQLNERQGSEPHFNDVTVLHVELRRRLAARHFGAVEVKADVSLSTGGHAGQVPGEDGAERRLLEQTEDVRHVFGG